MTRPDLSKRPEDVAAIGAVTAAAFLGRPYSSQTEALIVAALRAAGALSLSLVAEVDGEIVGRLVKSVIDTPSMRYPLPRRGPPPSERSEAPDWS